ncbi:MAG: hypothetical protein M5U26_08135 [Planctomycetota bacterium]|nr:hypothetical protein [Planctomycetota bacterium]
MNARNDLPIPSRPSGGNAMLLAGVALGAMVATPIVLDQAWTLNIAKAPLDLFTGLELLGFCAYLFGVALVGTWTSLGLLGVWAGRKGGRPLRLAVQVLGIAAAAYATLPGAICLTVIAMHLKGRRADLEAPTPEFRKLRQESFSQARLEAELARRRGGEPRLQFTILQLYGLAIGVMLAASITAPYARKSMLLAAPLEAMSFAQYLWFGLYLLALGVVGSWTALGALGGWATRNGGWWLRLLVQALGIAGAAALTLPGALLVMYAIMIYVGEQARLRDLDELKNQTE